LSRIHKVCTLKALEENLFTGQTPCKHLTSCFVAVNEYVVFTHSVLVQLIFFSGITSGSKVEPSTPK